ncbi:FAD-dependent oxidoreductase [Rhizorhabdus histidinilytica]|uniref:Succinate dehydrogenase/fumarate reductase, flavoprotein subunit n=1 Tax=Rhizorhabdus histidinilytica TaxID=439228 RepID=A0A1T5GUC5_9SPHN|nr:FAD-dependent oxidoreductase [Rhizorhabdus histidinilytica]SKC12005.1 Succinate dehydrogenase/fumarate reductase, flavoprotein subunit [Rhizorhabdus histidinilytica]
MGAPTLIDCDVAVVGSGAAGMAAAIVAASKGLRVILVEKAPLLGGTTALSGGGIWVPANSLMRAAGFDDSVDSAMAYLCAIIGPQCDRAAIANFLAHAPEAIDYLRDHSDLAFSTRTFSPDYYSEEPEATRSSRALDTVEYDGRLLGEDLALIRPPRPESLLFGGMAVSGADVAQLRNSFRSPTDFLLTAGKLLAYGVRRLRYGRDTRLVLGQAMIGRMLKSLRTLGVRIIVDAPAERLIEEAESIRGVEIRRGGKSVRIAATRGIVLAAGGFGHDRDMINTWIPSPEHHLAVGVPETTGDGIRLGLSVRGLLSRTDGRDSAYWSPVSRWTKADGSQRTFPHLVSDRAKPGVIAVDQQGNRFVDEATTYHDFVRAMHDPARQSVRNPCWLICDATALRAYGLGHARPWPFPKHRLLADGYLIRSRSIEALAMRLAIEPAALRTTVERYNADAARGVDREQGKGATVYDRSMGDPLRQPNPCLAPVSKPPFYAVQIFAGSLGTSRGLRTDAHARVIDRDGRPVAGLYAVGNDADAVFQGAYPGPGASLGPALTSSYLAACDLAGKCPGSKEV